MTQIFNFLLESDMTDHTNTQTDVKPCDPITPVESAESSESVVDIEYPHSEWYYEPNANLEIVTSDGILIRLEAYRLQASSWVVCFNDPEPS